MKALNQHVLHYSLVHQGRHLWTTYLQQSKVKWTQSLEEWRPLCRKKLVYRHQEKELCLPFVIMDIFESTSSNQPTWHSHNDNSPTRRQDIFAQRIQSLSTKNTGQNTKNNFSYYVQSRHYHGAIVSKHISTVDQRSKTISLSKDSTICRDGRPKSTKSPSDANSLCESEVEQEIAKSTGCKSTDCETARSPVCYVESVTPVSSTWLP